jgi:predicted component of type VI protein secretion system
VAELDFGSVAESASPRVWISDEGGPPRSVPLEEGRSVAGRGDRCQIRLEDEAVSWDHLEIERRGPSLIASDLDSRNGTLLNGEPLDRPRRLRDGDVLGVGRFRLEVSLPPQVRHEATAAAPGRPIELTAEERDVARALVAPYRAPGVRAGRPATRAEVAEALHVSERTVQRRLDALAIKLSIPADAGRERPRLIAERVLELGLDRAQG